MSNASRAFNIVKAVAGDALYVNTERFRRKQDKETWKEFRNRMQSAGLSAKQVRRRRRGRVLTENRRELTLKVT